MCRIKRNRQRDKAEQADRFHLQGLIRVASQVARFRQHWLSTSSDQASCPDGVSELRLVRKTNKSRNPFAAREPLGERRISHHHAQELKNRGEKGVLAPICYRCVCDQLSLAMQASISIAVSTDGTSIPITRASLSISRRAIRSSNHSDCCSFALRLLPSVRSW